MSGYLGPSPVPQATQTRQTFTATASQTSFATGGYQAGYLDVFLNGVKLVDGTDYTATNGSDVVLTTGAASGDTLEVVAYTAFTVADQAFTGDISIENLDVTGSFTSQGIDDNATSTAMTLDASGNLLVGKTSLGAATGVELASSGQIAVTRDGAVPAFLRRNNSDGSLIDFNKDGAPVGSIGVGGSNDLTIGDGPAGLIMDGDGATPIIGPWNTSTNSTSDASVDLGYGGGRFKDLYLSGGVYLGGTGAANKLDDYEEGTWTPSFSNIGTGTYAVRLGSYIKIGSLVTVQCHLGINVVGSASGTLKVGGFPFASSNNVGAIYGVSSSIHGTGWSVQRNSINLILGPSATETNDAYYNMASGVVFNPTHADLGGGNLLFSMTYRTDA